MYKIYNVKNNYNNFNIWKTKYIYCFDSIKDFVKYIEENKTRECFERSKLSSKKENFDNWSGTETYEQAIEFLQNGWDEGAKILNSNISKKIKDISKAEEKVFQNIKDVCGYQPIVPLYLNSVPNCMIRKQQKVLKNKIVNVTRTLSYSGGIRTSEVMSESVKAAMIIKNLEKSGYRVNLHLILGSGKFAVKIKLKSANERLNVSKLAFPLINVAMFRRLYFRFVEVCEKTTGDFVFGYGRVPAIREFDEICKEMNEIHLPTLINLNEKEATMLSADELIEKLKK